MEEPDFKPERWEDEFQGKLQDTKRKKKWCWYLQQNQRLQRAPDLFSYFFMCYEWILQKRNERLR